MVSKLTLAIPDHVVNLYRYDSVLTHFLFSVNKEGTCARNICECDKRWSETLARLEDDFNPRYHKNRGVGIEPAWKYNNECKRSKGIFGKPEECCGASYPDKMPLQKVQRADHLLNNNVKAKLLIRNRSLAVQQRVN